MGLTADELLARPQLVDAIGERCQHRALCVCVLACVRFTLWRRHLASGSATNLPHSVCITKSRSPPRTHHAHAQWAHACAVSYHFVPGASIKDFAVKDTASGDKALISSDANDPTLLRTGTLSLRVCATNSGVGTNRGRTARVPMEG
jgi:hypothetical protein